jgi:hypothetical protein
MRARIPLLRVVALLGVGALAVHQLRYSLGYGASAPDAVAVQGHAYVSAAAVLIAVLLVAALTGSLATLVRGRAGEASPSSSFGAVWARTSGALMALYAVQELLEGLLATGHPAGIPGLVGHGGWMAFLLAPAVGALLALGMRGERAARALASPPAPRPGRPRPATIVLPRAPLLHTPNGVARHLAGRGPPPLSR